MEKGGATPHHQHSHVEPKPQRYSDTIFATVQGKGTKDIRKTFGRNSNVHRSTCLLTIKYEDQDVNTYSFNSEP